MKKSLFLTILIFGCIFNIKAQTYVLDYTDPTTFEINCGTANPAQWTVKNDSCMLVTPVLYPRQDSGDSVMVNFTIRINQSGNLQPDDNAYVHIQMNGGAYNLKKMFQGDGSPRVFSYIDSNKVAKTDNFSLRITLQTDNNSEFWAVKNGDVEVGNASKSQFLPVALLTFSAEIIENDINLKWATASETNSEYFAIEKSKSLNSDSAWIQAGVVPGQGTSNTLIEYEYLDKEAYEGITYYRLRQVDINGDLKYSDPIVVNRIIIDDFSYSIVPNPTGEDEATLFINNKTLANLLIVVYDESGKLMQTTNPCIVNSCVLKLDFSSYQNGIYFITIKKDDKLYQNKIVKTD